MSTVSQVQRNFFFQINNEPVTLTDIPNLSVHEIKEFYSTQYPQLINASIENKGFVNMKSTFEFVTIAGTKA